MKRTLILTTLLLAAACTGTLEHDGSAPGDGLHPIIIKAGTEQTKTSFGAEENGVMPFLWSSGDKLGLFLSQGGSVVSTAANIPAAIVTNILDSGPGYNIAYFKADTAVLAKNVDYDAVLYYPYRQGAGASSDVLTHRISARQVQKAGDRTDHLGLGGGFACAQASFATPDDFTDWVPQMVFTLSHKTSYVLLDMKAADPDAENYKVTSVTFTAPEGKYIAGDVRYTTSTDTFELTGNRSCSIVLDIPAGAPLSTSAGTPAGIVVFPESLAGESVILKYTLESIDGSAVKTVTHTRILNPDSEAFAIGGIHCFEENIPSADAAGWVYGSATFDLSAEGTANSYRVSARGTYSFDATVIGNGASGILLPLDESHFHTTVAGISPVGARLLWQTAPGLITNVAFSGGRISFTKPDDTKGNAVIAAVDSGDNILWSWHIWCSDLGPTQAYVTPYNTYMAMDRSLGATYGTTVNIKQPDHTAEQMACFGLFYQWGRKDPFIYANTLSTSGTRTFADIYDAAGDQIAYKDDSTHRPFETEVTTTEIGTQAYAAAHPFTFIVDADPTISSYDWYAELGAGSKPEFRGYAFWGNPNGHLYAKPDAPKPVKTIYDPCPPGWMVPPVDFFLALTAVEYYPAGNKVKYDGVNTSWYQRQGMIRGTTAALYYANSNGYYWTSGRKTGDTYAVVSMYMTGAGSSWARQNAVKCANAFPIRCIQEL